MTERPLRDGALRQLLSSQSQASDACAAFLSDHYLKLPFSSQAGARTLVDLGSWNVVESLFTVAEADIRLSKQGAIADPPRPSFSQARDLFHDGHTIFIRHAERHHAGLAELAEGFARDLAAPIDVHLFCTPADSPGFSWHYDAEEVFILQTEGTKNYQLRKNTVNPWPLVETLPENMRYEREIMPLLRCTLSAGDWLYIPAGYWHQTSAVTDSISLAVGALAPAALDLFDSLRRELLDSLLWRQRLPIMGHASSLSADELRERLGQIVVELQADLGKRLTDPQFIERYLADRISDAKSLVPTDCDTAD